MLGLNPITDKVRIGWQTSGAPAWKISEDIIFIMINNVDDPIIKQRDIEYSNKDADNAKQTVSYTKVHAVKWVLYGPNSYENAEKIRNAIYLQEFKELFSKNNLYLILDVTTPTRFPELFNGNWWERSDFTASFNELIIVSNTVPYIQSASYEIKKG